MSTETMITSVVAPNAQARKRGSATRSVDVTEVIRVSVVERTVVDVLVRIVMAVVVSVVVTIAFLSVATLRKNCE